MMSERCFWWVSEIAERERKTERRKELIGSLHDRVGFRGTRAGVEVTAVRFYFQRTVVVVQSVRYLAYSSGIVLRGNEKIFERETGSGDISHLLPQERHRR